SSILASSNVLIMLIAFMILSLFAAIASVTSAKLSCLICSSDFCMRLIFVILSAIIYSPDFLGKCNHHVSICLQHVRYIFVVFFSFVFFSLFSPSFFFHLSSWEIFIITFPFVFNTFAILWLSLFIYSEVCRV